MRTVCLLIVGVVVGWIASGVDWSGVAVGQDQPRNPDPSALGVVGPELQQRIGDWRKEAADFAQINRYQISAYGSQSSNGCYVVDSATGTVWRVRKGDSPEVIARELPTK